jgi:hypothetical protein
MDDTDAMIDRASADDLLATARAALLDELLPQLPSSAHYTARMIAHAIGIAAREIAAPPLDAGLQAELAALAGSEGADAAFVARVLAERIRNGAFDENAAAAARLHRALTAWTQARLALTDPRAARVPADR